MKRNKNSTITALATPVGIGALHIIRLSGPDAFEIINQITDKKITYNTIPQLAILNNHLKQPIDQVVLIKFLSPASYTGEDLIEINCHGNMLIVELILESLIKHGATVASKGEFTKRAYLNNKINLNQASAIFNLIHASSWEEIQSAHYNLSNKYIQLFTKYLEQIFQWIAYCEIQIDYPDEESKNTNDFYHNLKKEIKNISLNLQQILKSTKYKKNSRWKATLIGCPNVGKSSLINVLLKEERVIVSSEKGTTRDQIEIDYYLPEGLITIVDTAGIFESDNIINKQAIEQTKKAIQTTDLVVHLIAANDLNNCDNEKIKKLYIGKKSKIVYTKADLKSELFQNEYMISSINGDINVFLNLLSSEFKKTYSYDGVHHGLANEYNNTTMINLCKIFKKIHESLNDLSYSIDLLAEDLLLAHHYFCIILQKNEQSEIINKIFSNFCLGK